MRIQYNSPIILTYTLICVTITTLDYILFQQAPVDPTHPDSYSLTKNLFTVYPNMSFSSPLTYFHLFSHAMGHANWSHLLGNFSFILLIGPILEEKYGSRALLLMMFLTALITGILQTMLFSGGLLGASGVVFMLIMLISFTNMKSGKIPLTFILITVLYLGQEVYNALLPSETSKGISQFAHIIGGICGGVFGYLTNKTSNKPLKTDPNTGVTGIQ